jgi:hypothetical protein
VTVDSEIMALTLTCEIIGKLHQSERLVCVSFFFLCQDLKNYIVSNDDEQKMRMKMTAFWDIAALSTFFDMQLHNLSMSVTEGVEEPHP